MPIVSDSVRNLAASMVVMALIILALIAGKDILIPLALSCILAFILVPVVGWLTQHRVPHGAAVGGIMLLTVVLLAGAAIGFSAQILSATTTLESNKQNIVSKLRDITGKDSQEGLIGRAIKSIDALEKAVSGELKSDNEAKPPSAPIVVAEQKPADASGSMLDLAKAAISPLATFFLTILFTAFLLLQSHDLRDRIVRVLGTDNMSGTTSALSEAGDRLGQLFLGQAMLNAGFGAFIATALWLVGMPNALLWGLAAALLRFVPYIGAFLSSLPPLFLAAAIDPTWTTFIIVAAIFLLSEPLMGHVIDPMVLGKRVGLSPFAMITAASFWTLVWGPTGLLLAAPLTMVLVVIGENIPQLNFLAILLGDKPALDPKTQFYHRLLSNDAASAIEQIETAMQTEPAKRVADTIILPALRLAALDQRRGRISAEQLDELQETMVEIMEEMPVKAGTALSANAPQRHVVVIPARGTIDVIASQFVASLLAKTGGVATTSVTESSGMMALASIETHATSASGLPTIVLSTAGGMDGRHMRLLAKRAQRQFAGATIIMCDWVHQNDESSALPSGADSIADVHVCNSMAELVGLIQLSAFNGPEFSEQRRTDQSAIPSPA